MKKIGCSFALLLLLCLVSCDLGGSGGCPDGQQCCEIADPDHPYAQDTYQCMTSCPGGSAGMGSVDPSTCTQGAASLRKSERLFIGQRVSLPAKTDQALLLFTSPSCRYAAANDSFHRDLYRAAVEANIPFYVVVAQHSDAMTFKNRGEFDKAPILLTSDLPFHSPGTPTVVLVQNGQIRATWTGEQKTVKQQQIVLSRIANIGIVHP